MNVFRLKTFRNLQRSRQIVAVLIKYGFSEIVDRLNLTSRLKLKRKFQRSPEAIEHKYTAAERVRLALEELGPTFVKFGQMLSTRSFLMPAKFIEELSKLQDNVKPADFAELVPIIEDELGAPPSQLFEWFDENPIASASMAQAYRARRFDGVEVIVKIQRPKIDHIVRTDMEILQQLAILLERYIPESQQYNPTGLVDELSRSFQKELNFVYEARNIERFAQNFQRFNYIKVPKVFWEQCTERIVTLEYIDGVKVSDVDTLREMGVDFKRIARLGARFILQQIFIDGFFHADPHPGNLFISKDHKIALIDFGIMGQFDDWMMSQISDALLGLSRKDVDLLLEVLINLGAIDEDRDLTQIRQDISQFINHYYGLPLVMLNIKTIFSEGLELMNRYKIRVPSNLLLLGKTLGIYEDIGRRLEPDFNFAEHIKPFVGRIIRRRLNPNMLAYETSKGMRDLYNLLKILPRELELLLKRMRRGNMGVELRHRGLENFIREMDRSSNRISFSLIIAAIIVASSLIMHMERGPFLFGYPLIGVLGYVFAGILGMGLVIAILRSGRL